MPNLNKSLARTPVTKRLNLTSKSVTIHYNITSCLYFTKRWTRRYLIIIIISPQLSTAEHRPPLERTYHAARSSALLIQCPPAIL